MDNFEKSIADLGGPAAAAALLGISIQRLCNWVDRGVPIEHGALVDHVVGFRRWHQRPDDWHRIWPELIGADGAPPVPVEVANG